MPVPDNRTRVAWRWANSFLAKMMRSLMQENGKDAEMPDPSLLAHAIREAYDAGWDACLNRVRATVDDPMNNFDSSICPRCGNHEAEWQDGSIDFATEEEGCMPVATLEHFICKSCDYGFTVREPIPDNPS